MAERYWRLGIPAEAVRGFWLKLVWLWPERGEPDPLAALRELGVF